MSDPRRRFDPLALAVHGAALALVGALGLYVFLSVRTDPQSQQTFPDIAGIVEKAMRDRIQPVPPPTKSASAAKVPASTGKPAAIMLALPDAGRWWRYNVTVEPPAWRDITLTYRAVEQGQELAIQTEFRHAGGESKFLLGTYAPRHPSHANTRFPGFFMHPAYFDRPLDVGQRYAWEWAWQLPGGAVRAGRVKRYEAEVKGWEDVRTPAGVYASARIEATLSYIDGGRKLGSARETLWYSPRAMQLVKVVREGRTPDDGLDRIVAELAQAQ